jgi:hypothetical protein
MPLRGISGKLLCHRRISVIYQGIFGAHGANPTFELAPPILP